MAFTRVITLARSFVTKASTILQFIDGLRGELQVTFEEGTSAAWLYDLLKPHVTKLVVCDPRKNKELVREPFITQRLTLFRHFGPTPRFLI